MSPDPFGNPDPVPARTGGSLGNARDEGAPLAVGVHPANLDELVGQQRLLGPRTPLRRSVAGQPISVLLWGPPGAGKTTLAPIVSNASRARFIELLVVTAGVRELYAEFDVARRELGRGTSTVLLINEVHRFSKTQQDALLSAVENRIVTLVAATTENPGFSVISLLLSHSLLLRLKPLTDTDISALVSHALVDERGLAGTITLADTARSDLVRLAGGDARRALTYLEEATASAEALGLGEITSEVLVHMVGRAAVRYDRDGDQHYDVVSAFIKSVRGFGVDMALYYLAQMLEAGEDPRFIACRLMISASEDIGMAASGVLGTCVAAAQAVQLLGMPETHITLTHTTAAVTAAPKSSVVYIALKKAAADIHTDRGRAVPAHLRDVHYVGAKAFRRGEGYVYPHDLPSGVAAQQYLPDDLAGISYYQPTGHGSEAAISERMAAIRKLLGH